MRRISLPGGKEKKRQKNLGTYERFEHPNQIPLTTNIPTFLFPSTRLNPHTSDMRPRPTTVEAPEVGSDALTHKLHVSTLIKAPRPWD